MPSVGKYYSIKKDNKGDKYEYDRLFKRGCKLSYILYTLTIIFFIAWLIGNSKEFLMIVNSTPYSRIFFFLNPNLFKHVFLKGNGLVWAQGAVSLGSFTFLICYLITLLSFVSILYCAIWLFLISYHTAVRPFHYISCFSIFPIISCFLLTWFIIKLVSYQISTKLKQGSKFAEDFVPEVFDGIAEKMDPMYLASRPITDEFTYQQYKSCYKNVSKQDPLKDMYKKLNDYLS